MIIAYHKESITLIANARVTMVPGATAANGGMTESVTRVDSATTSLKFHAETIASSKSHKISSVGLLFSF